MNHHASHRTAALALSGLFVLTALGLSSGAASASRLPADPITFVGTPAPMARYVLDAQAAHVWAALEDLRSA